MKPRAPNILHLFTDMQRWDTLGCYGNPVIKTPNLDALARDGVVFENAYTPSPVCVAARCSMIYGQYPWSTGCYENAAMPADSRASFMQALTERGYRAHGIGKCHFTPDPHALRGFETREHQEEGGARDMDALDRCDYLRYLHDKGYRHICEAFGVRGEMYYIPQPSQVPAEDHPSQWIGDRSIAFIEQSAQSSRPRYLFSSFIHPHPPLTPPNPWHKLYRPAMMPLPNLPPDYESLHTFVNKHQNRYKYRDQGMDMNLVRAIKAYYYACVSFVDYQVGRIISALAKAGQLDNTLIVFSSDHGELLGDYNCFGKRSMHDGSTRIPMLVRYPKRFAAGTRCSAPVSLVDIAPTVLGAADAQIKTHELEGEDMAEVAAGKCERDTVYAQLAMNNGRRFDLAQEKKSFDGLGEQETRAKMSTYMAVSREWKYSYSAPDDREFLFDRVGDPHETRNRAGVSFCDDALTEMRSRIISKLRSAGESAGIGDKGKWRSFGALHLDPNPDAGLLIQDMYTPWAQMNIPGYTQPAVPKTMAEPKPEKPATKKSKAKRRTRGTARS